MLQLDLLRHGEPVGGQRYRGQLDDPLSDTGWAQMRRSVGGYRRWDKIITSPLRRCRAFAETLAAETGLPLEVEAKLQEINFGRWEGLTKEEVSSRFKEEWARFYADPVRNTPVQAEPLMHFSNRVRLALENIVAQNKNMRILHVSHAGVIRIALHEVLKFPLERVFRVKVPYACISRITFQNSEYLSSNVEFHAGVLESD